MFHSATEFYKGYIKTDGIHCINDNHFIVNIHGWAHPCFGRKAPFEFSTFLTILDLGWAWSVLFPLSHSLSLEIWRYTQWGFQLHFSALNIASERISSLCLFAKYCELLAVFKKSNQSQDIWQSHVPACRHFSHSLVKNIEQITQEAKVKYSFPLMCKLRTIVFCYIQSCNRIWP